MTIWTVGHSTHDFDAFVALLCPHGITQLADIFRGKIVDVGNESLIVEVTGDEEKVNSLLQMLRPFGIKEMVRTGIVSMTRGGGTVARLGEERLEAAG